MVNVYIHIVLHNIGGIKGNEVDNFLRDVDNQLEKNIDFIIILEGRLLLSKQQINARLTNYKLFIAWFNINVFARKELNPTVLAETSEVGSFINGDTIITTFYLTPFNKSPVECTKLMNGFLLHLKSIVSHNL